MAEEKTNGYYKVDIIADLFGVSVRRIQQLTQEGVISTVAVSYTHLTLPTIEPV